MQLLPPPPFSHGVSHPVLSKQVPAGGPLPPKRRQFPYKPRMREQRMGFPPEIPKSNKTDGAARRSPYPLRRMQRFKTGGDETPRLIVDDVHRPRPVEKPLS